MSRSILVDLNRTDGDFGNFRDFGRLGPAAQSQCFNEGRLILLLGDGIDRPKLHQKIPHQSFEAGLQFPARDRPLILDGSGNERDEKRDLLRGEGRWLLVEVVPRRRAQPVERGTPLDDVQLDLENAVFPERRLEQEGVRQFPQFALQALLPREEEVLGQLLGDG